MKLGVFECPSMETPCADNLQRGTTEFIRTVMLTMAFKGLLFCFRGLAGWL